MTGALFKGVLIFSLLVGFATLVVLLIQVASDGLGHLSWDFITSFPSSLPSRAGIQSPLVGTIYLMVLVALITIPIGVGAALYLEEYADRTRWYNRAIELNIQNLAAVPSIVYGILGLAFLVRGPIGLGRVLLAGALTLSLLVLPIVIIASREAIRAVPPSIREGALALGATRWQTIWRQVLPAAVPGIATGSILALSRAIGETAPADPDRRDRVRAVQPLRPHGPVHGAADPDLQLDLAAPGGVQASGRRGDHRAARPAADHECIRDMAPEQIST